MATLSGIVAPSPKLAEDIAESTEGRCYAWV